MITLANIYAVSNLEESIGLVNKARSEGRNGTLVYIGDPIEAPNIPPEYGITMASGVPFCPDYNILSLYINGDFVNYQNMYIQSLKTEPAIRVFNAILVYLMSGNDIILYFPSQTLDLKYPELLLQFFVMEYGITVATKNTECAFSTGYTQHILDQLYVFDSISLYDYVAMSDNVNPAFIQKMSTEAAALHPDKNIQGMTTNQFIQFLTEMKNNGVPLAIEQNADRAFTIK